MDLYKMKQKQNPNNKLGVVQGYGIFHTTAMGDWLVWCNQLLNACIVCIRSLVAMEKWPVNKVCKQ
jgi:hypothetical protein